mgnify:CR=1 FL=1
MARRLTYPLRRTAPHRLGPGDVCVIEAPGKAPALRAILGDIPEIVATGGHVMIQPQRLTPVSITPSLLETGRRPKKPHRIAAIEAALQRSRTAAGQAPRVTVLTDADTEGAAIGLDVVDTVHAIDPDANVRLAPLAALTAEAVDDALNRAHAPDLDDVQAAAPARGRAIVDRLIGGVFSGDGVAVGRVLTAALGVFARGDAEVGRVYERRPAHDAGSAWTRERALLRRDVIDSSHQPDPAAADHPGGPDFEAPASTAPARPGLATMADILIAAEEDLGLGPRETEASLQRLYETGRISYPRTAVRTAGTTGQWHIRRAALAAGIHRLDLARVAPDGEETSDDGESRDPAADNAAAPDSEGGEHGKRRKAHVRVRAHEGLYPLTDVDASGQPIARGDPRRKDPDQAVLTLIAQTAIEAATPRTHETRPDTAGGTPWSRTVGPRLHWRPRIRLQSPDRRILWYTPAGAALRTLRDHNLGRPSTFATHANTLVARGLITTFQSIPGLSERGTTSAHRAPAWARKPTTSAVIEARLAAAGRSIPRTALARTESNGTLNTRFAPVWAATARHALGVLPPEAREKIAAHLAEAAAVAPMQPDTSSARPDPPPSTPAEPPGAAPVPTDIIIPAEPIAAHVHLHMQMADHDMQKVSATPEREPRTPQPLTAGAKTLDTARSDATGFGDMDNETEQAKVDSRITDDITLG